MNLAATLAAHRLHLAPRARMSPDIGDRRVLGWRWLCWAEDEYRHADPVVASTPERAVRAWLRARQQVAA